MKRKIIAAIMAAVMLCTITTTQAFAASATAGSTEITYTYDPEYIINIPASISINANGIMEFTAENLKIGAAKRVVVSIDPDKTYENGGNFYLYKDKGTADEEKLSCTIFRGMYSMNSSWSQIMGLEVEVAEFLDGQTTPKRYGALKFEPNVENGTSYGTYAGNIYFKIELMDKT